MRSRRLWLLALVEIILSGCGSSSESPRLTGVAITPRGDTLAPGAAGVFRVIGSYADGSSRDLADVGWRARDSSVATVNSYGTAIGVSLGETVIEAEVGGLRDSAVVDVTSARAGKMKLGPLRVSAANARYFADPSGLPVYLTGSHYWKNVQDNGVANPPAPFDNDSYLAFLQSHNHNFTRLWVWEQARWSGEVGYSHWFAPTLYERTGPGTAADGGPRFDLTRLNPAYFIRLRQRVIDAAARGIYVSVMLFDGWSVETKPGNAKANPWLGHPFHRLNNINGINGDTNGDGSGRETHALSIPAVTKLQKAYVSAVIDAVNDQDNVIYEISNESDSSSIAWQYHIIDFVRSHESKKGKQHPIGMTVPWPGANRQVLNSPAEWVSMNGDVSNPVVADARKVSLSDTDHLCGICGDVAWVWKAFTRGHNALLMDGYDASAGVSEPSYKPDDHRWNAIRSNMGHARRYAMRMDLARAVPRGDLASSTYCLAVIGSEYLVFLPTGGRASVNLIGAEGAFDVEWFDPATGKTAEGGTASGGSAVEIRAPFEGPAVLYLHRASR